VTGTRRMRRGQDDPRRLKERNLLQAKYKNIRDYLIGQIEATKPAYPALLEFVQGPPRDLPEPRPADPNKWMVFRGQRKVVANLAVRRADFNRRHSDRPEVEAWYWSEAYLASLCYYPICAGFSLGEIPRSSSISQVNTPSASRGRWRNSAIFCIWP